MLDAESKPRTALLVLRERDENLEPNAATRMDKIFGKLLGLRTAAGFPPAFEYRPLFESLRSNRGDLVIERLRRPR